MLRSLVRAARLSREAAEREAAGDTAAAEADWRRALALREAAGAGRGQEQGSDQHALAALLVRLGRPEEAEPLARTALDGPEADAVAEHPVVWRRWSTSSAPLAGRRRPSRWPGRS